MTISMEHITKTYGARHVLKDFSLGIENEQTIILYGPSGSGKTTALRILLGLEKPDSGQVVLMGDYKYDYLNAGVVFQENRLCENLDAITNVTIASTGLTRGLARKELLKLLPEDRISIPVSSLSGGEKRRVAIVRAMVHPADIFIFDEPFTGLDPDMRTKALDYINEAKGSNPVVFTAHNPDDFSFGRKIEIPSSI